MQVHLRPFMLAPFSFCAFDENEIVHSASMRPLIFPLHQPLARREFLVDLLVGVLGLLDPILPPSGFDNTVLGI